jgi:hypothetical protein
MMGIELFPSHLTWLPLTYPTTHQHIRLSLHNSISLSPLIYHLYHSITIIP